MFLILLAKMVEFNQADLRFYISRHLSDNSNARERCCQKQRAETKTPPGVQKRGFRRAERAAKRREKVGRYSSPF